MYIIELRKKSFKPLWDIAKMPKGNKEERLSQVSHIEEVLIVFAKVMAKKRKKNKRKLKKRIKYIVSESNMVRKIINEKFQ